MPWKCPECHATISELNYEVSTSSSELGTATIDPDHITTGYISDIIIEHDYDETGNTDWNGDPTYTCTECDNRIRPTELIWFDECDDDDLIDEDNENCSKPKENTEEESTHDIIKPKEDIFSTDHAKDASKTNIICKNCFHLFVTSKSEENSWDEDEPGFYECPKCNELNSKKEFCTLLKDGYFSVDTVKRPKPKTNI